MFGDFEIEHGIPLDDRETYGTSRRKYPFAKMKVGDSFFAGPRDARALKSSASHYARAHGIRLATRKEVKDGVVGRRCWRIEDPAPARGKEDRHS